MSEAATPATAKPALRSVTIALDVLGFVGNKGAGAQLVTFAASSAEEPLRVRAMLAAGLLRDPALAPRIEEFILPKGLEGVAPGDPVTIAAGWALAQIKDKKAVSVQLRDLIRQ